MAFTYPVCGSTVITAPSGDSPGRACAERPCSALRPSRSDCSAASCMVGFSVV
jgi:hypothetical protein